MTESSDVPPSRGRLLAARMKDMTEKLETGGKFRVTQISRCREHKIAWKAADHGACPMCEQAQDKKRYEQLKQLLNWRLGSTTTDLQDSHKVVGTSWSLKTHAVFCTDHNQPPKDIDLAIDGLIDIPFEDDDAIIDEGAGY